MSIQIQVRRIATAILFRSGSKVVFDSGLVFNMSMSLREGAFSLIGTVNRTRLTRQSFQWAFHQSVGCSISMDTLLHGLSLHLTVFSENQCCTSQYGRQPAAALPLAHLRDFSAKQLGRQRRQVLALLFF
jgi:hypothetical protein